MTGVQIAVWCLVSAVGLSIVLLAMRVLLRRMQAWEANHAVRKFRLQREVLEAKFFDLASRSGKPRDVTWLQCEWQDHVTFARDLQTGLLTAFAAVNIRFAAVEGGEMEEVDAVGLMRDAVAVFHFQRGRWGTGGKALFNMNPDDAIVRLQTQYESVTV